MKRIGLCLIVKNEAHVIERCLASVRPLVDYVLVADTGSTDGTQAKAESFLKTHGLAGKVVEHEWQNFAHNRSRALAELRTIETIDYALMIDADETLVYEPGFDPAAFKARLKADLYDIRTEMSAVYYRPQLFSNRSPFRFRGVLHEFLECSDIRTRETALGFHNHPIQDSARNKNPAKYRDDANVLRRALENETDPFLISRYTFYLAQSLRDAGEPAQALTYFLRRAELGFWHEEIHMALLNAARLMERLGHPSADIIDTYVRAFETCDSRAEALHGAARYCRLNNRPLQAAMLARRGLDIAKPATGLFLESWIYDYGLLDEYSISAYWAGQYEESLRASRRLIAENKFPAQQRQRLLDNAAFALARIDERAVPATHRPDAAVTPGSSGFPRILVSILAKQKEPVLPFYLKCIEALDYPRSAISLYVRTNNSLDGTARILRDWLERVGPAYERVEFDDSDVEQPVQSFGVHEWNAMRFQVLADIRQESLQKTLDWGCDFYFTADVDNFIRPPTLRALVAENLPIVAPLLRHVDPADPYSNFHSEIDEDGYFRLDEHYYDILYRRLRGTIALPVVHCTYLILADSIPKLSYRDDSGRHEYVVFSHSARRNDVPQYFDNREIYGYLTSNESSVAARLLMEEEVELALRRD